MSLPLYLAVCAAVFAAAYVINVLTITVGYHRALAHGALRLHPVLRRALIACGPWVTGIDPKAWVVMHRRHHAFSDTPLDPHSPVNVGILGIAAEQLRSYKRAIVGIMRAEPEYTRFAVGLDFPLSRLNTARLWWLPYAAHALVGVALGVAGGWLLGAAYFFGMTSHPVQGGLVNALGHAIGKRNFDTDDNSRNNLVAAWLIFGEGFQNNHHRYPASARFSYRASEIDLGYGACLALEALGLAEIDRAHLIPRPARRSKCARSKPLTSAGERIAKAAH